MPKFAGPKNVVLFSEDHNGAPFDCTYDPDSGLYSVDLSAEDAAQFGPALIHEGMTEDADASPTSVAPIEPVAPAAPVEIAPEAAPVEAVAPEAPVASPEV